MRRIAPYALAGYRCLPLLLLPLVAACAGLGPFGAHGRIDTRAAHVTVRNDHWEDLTIYLERDGSSFRLGVVPGNSQRSLTVPHAYLSKGTAMYLAAMQIGRETHARSAPFGLAPGSRARWVISLNHMASPVIVDVDGS